MRDVRDKRGSGQKVQIQPDRKNIRRYREMGVSCTSTDNRIKEFSRGRNYYVQYTQELLAEGGPVSHGSAAG